MAPLWPWCALENLIWPTKSPKRKFGNFQAVSTCICQQLLYRIHCLILSCYLDFSHAIRSWIRIRPIFEACYMLRSCCLKPDLSCMPSVTLPQYQVTVAILFSSYVFQIACHLVHFDIIQHLYNLLSLEYNCVGLFVNRIMKKRYPWRCKVSSRSGKTQKFIDKMKIILNTYWNFNLTVQFLLAWQSITRAISRLISSDKQQ